MEKIGFILHGKIQGKNSVKGSLANKFSVDYEVCFYETTRPRHAEQLTLKALEDGVDFLIAVGGDGTLNEMINGYLNFGGTEKCKTLLGVLPYGTGNDFARGVGITRNIEHLWDMMQKKMPVSLDAGSMQFRQPDGSVSIRYFDNIADIGIGAAVVEQVNGVHLRKKILGGTLTFFLSVLITFLTYKPRKIRVSWEGFEWEGNVLSFVVANGQFFGSGLGVAPDARMDDGMFEVVIFADLSIIDYLRNFARVRRSQKVLHPQAFYYRANRILVEPVSGIPTVEADGEIEGKAPLVYTCLPGILPFLAP